MINIIKEMEVFERNNAPLSKQFKLKKQVAEEAFIRRVSQLGLPMMLKGSYVTRQYLPEHLKAYRIPADLDWFGLTELEEKKLNKWMIAATTCQLEDGLYFRNFTENAFWRMIDYAMADDFPTVNTDLLVYFNKEREQDQSYEIYNMDISFNLQLASPPVFLEYSPLIGEPFIIPYSCPLDIQLAWKLHQCIVRPRFKDLVDIIWLLEANANINWDIVFQSIKEECLRDNPKRSNIKHLQLLFDQKLPKHPSFSKKNDSLLDTEWPRWRLPDEHKAKYPNYSFYGETMLTSFHIDSPIPKELNELLDALDSTLTNTGFKEYLEKIN